MKKYTILFFLIALAVTPGWGQSTVTLDFRITNPRIIYGWNNKMNAESGGYCENLDFDLAVKGSALSYCHALEVHMTNNNSAITDPDFTLASNWYPLPYYNYNSQSNLENFNINVTVYNTLSPTAGPASKWTQIPTTWKTVGTLRLRITDVSQVENCSWLPAQMLVTQLEKYFTPSINVRSYYGVNCNGVPVSDLFLGRIYSSTLGWSQVGGAVEETQYLDWSTAVNTSVWDAPVSGAAEISGSSDHLTQGLRVHAGARLKILYNSWMTCMGTAEINEPQGLRIASDATGTGSFIDNGTITYNTGGTATAERYIGAWGTAIQGWHLLSSPVGAQAFQPTFVSNPPSATEDFYFWDEATATWINSKSNATAPFVVNPYFTGNFETGKGYLVAYASNVTKSFTGSLNVSNLTTPTLTYTSGAPYGGDATPGWNLLGNPYPSALAWNNGAWTLNNVDGLTQIWKDANSSYTVLNANGIIPAMQGFMVHVPSGTGSVTLPTSARTHNAQGWLKTTGNPYIKLVAHNLAEQTAQESVVTFDNQATTGYDGDYDSYFVPGYAPLFYSVAGTLKLAYNTLPVLESQTTVPFSFIKTSGLHFSIEAVQLDNIPTQEVNLIDLKMNQSQNLLVNPVYSFTAADGDDPSRFLLTFGHVVGSGEKTQYNNVIYSYENDLYIINPGKARLELYSLTGQKLHSEQIDSPGLFKTTLYLPTAYYIVRLTMGTKVVVTKIFLQS